MVCEFNKFESQVDTWKISENQFKYLNDTRSPMLDFSELEYLSQYKMQCMSCNAEMEYGFVVKEYRFCSLDCLQMKLSWEKIKRMYSIN